MVFEDTLDEKDYNRSKDEFESFAKQENFVYYDDALIKGSWNLDQFESHECVGCSRITQLFAMKAKKACYQIEFPTVSAAEGAKSLFAAEFRTPQNLTPNNYLLIGVNHQSAYFYDFVTVSAGHTYDIRITAQRDKSFPRSDSSCKSKEVVEETNYDQQICFDKCLIDHYVKNYNCKPISNGDRIFDTKRKNVDICSTKHGSLTKPGDNVTEPDESTVTNYIKQVTEKCQGNCTYPCDYTSYEYTLFEKSSMNTENATTLFFILMYARKGILTYQEIPTLSFQSAVSNVGGQLGLWMGLSIVSLVQVVSYFLNNCLKPRSVITPS